MIRGLGCYNRWIMAGRTNAQIAEALATLAGIMAR
ncbi:hypothetical protein A2U01_0053565, partial [Trifolium medium]|nr:hypothetical protein [Trifolium medium]